MSVKSLFACAFWSTCLFTSVWSAPYSSTPRYAQTTAEDIPTLIRELKVNFSSLKNSVNNHEIEIRTFENKLNSQESTLEHARQIFLEDNQSQKDRFNAFQVNYENKIHSLEQNLKQLSELSKNTVIDLKKLSSQANDTIVALNQQQQQIHQLEQTIHAQKAYIEHVETALQAVMQCIQTMETKETPDKSSSEKAKSYNIQSGDSLEKIARINGVSVQALRDANPQIKNDRIFPGQTIHIP